MTDDVIYRQAAIDFIDAGHLVNPNEPRWSDNEVVNFLKSRPSAQPEITVDGYADGFADGYKLGKKYAQPQRTGRWIPQDHNKSNGMVSTAVFYYPKCSECGHSGNYDMNFCPNCGAEMLTEDKG